MRSWNRWIVVAAVVAVAAPAAQAQQRGGRGMGGGRMTPTMLLGQKSVQDELKVSEDQVGKITQLAAKQREAFAELRNLQGEERQKKLQELNQANEKQLAEILKPEQLKRLKQIAWQQQGGQALAESDVAEALGLSGEQKEKIKTINEDAQKEMRELFQPGGNREEAQKKMAEMRKATEEKRMAVLTDTQKAKWKELLGEPFKGEITRPGRPGGDRPRADPPR
jgi:hypothetical protein